MYRCGRRGSVDHVGTQVGTSQLRWLVPVLTSTRSAIISYVRRSLPWGGTLSVVAHATMGDKHADVTAHLTILHNMLSSSMEGHTFCGGPCNHGGQACCSRCPLIDTSYNLICTCNYALVFVAICNRHCTTG